MTSYRPYVDWIHSKHEEMCQLLQGWSGVNSGTFNPAGLATQAELIATEFSQFSETTSLRDPNHYSRVDEHGHIISVPLGKNLHVVQRPEAPLKVLLAIHMDTVYGLDSSFQTASRVSDQVLVGPGAADAKGGIVILLYALRALEQFLVESGNERLGWEVIINSDEEIGSPGSLGLFEEAATRVDLGLLFEPSLPEGRLVSARKGSGNFSIVGHGRAAHSGRDFHFGVNAVVAAAEASAQLHQLTGQWENMTLNIARIDGGGPSNMIPPVSVIRLNIRYEHRQHEEEILSTMRKILEGVSHHSGVRFELHGHFSSPPKACDPMTLHLLQHLQRCGSELGLQLEWGPTGGACDGNRLAAMGVPNVDSLGVRGGKIHSHEEFVELDSLVERACLTSLYLMQLADGTLTPPLLMRHPGVQ